MSRSLNPEPEVTNEESDAPVDPNTVGGKDVTAVKPAGRRHVLTAAERQGRRGMKKARAYDNHHILTPEERQRGAVAGHKALVAGGKLHVFTDEERRRAGVTKAIRPDRERMVLLGRLGGLAKARKHPPKPPKPPKPRRTPLPIYGVNEEAPPPEFWIP